MLLSIISYYTIFSVSVRSLKEWISTALYEASGGKERLRVLIGIIGALGACTCDWMQQGSSNCLSSSAMAAAVLGARGDDAIVQIKAEEMGEIKEGENDPRKIATRPLL